MWAMGTHSARDGTVAQHGDLWRVAVRVWLMRCHFRPFRLSVASDLCLWPCPGLCWIPKCVSTECGDDGGQPASSSYPFDKCHPLLLGSSRP